MGLDSSNDYPCRRYSQTPTEENSQRFDSISDMQSELDSEDSTDYLLFVTSTNFRKHLGPRLQLALTECAASKPENPVEFIARFLERFERFL